MSNLKKESEVRGDGDALELAYRLGRNPAHSLQEDTARIRKQRAFEAARAAVVEAADRIITAWETGANPVIREQELINAVKEWRRLEREGK